nr:MAG TPA: hypothetical protein [Bacteriophage sp.]
MVFFIFCYTFKKTILISFIKLFIVFYSFSLQSYYIRINLCCQHFFKKIKNFFTFSLTCSILN